MNKPLAFDCNRAGHVFVSVDSLESFILEYAHTAKQLSEAADKEINLVKRQTFIQSLAEVTRLIFKAGGLLEEVEAKPCPSGTESDQGEL